MPRFLPCPPDFAEHAQERTEELKRRYGIRSDTPIKRWRKEVGIGGRPSRLKPPPVDFAEQATKLTRKGLARHYGVKWRAIERWVCETGAEPQDRVAPVPLAEKPADFAAVAPTMILKDLMERYSRSHSVIRRWCRESGVVPLSFERPQREPRAKPQPFHRVKAVPGQMVLPAASRPIALKAGAEEEAAQHLRRHFPFVYRCTERGGADQRGKFWRVGAVVLTPRELVEKAKRYGFDPDRWRNLSIVDCSEALASTRQAGA